jgi:hypothetical protein
MRWRSWIDPERLIIILNRLIDAALVRARETAAIESLYIICIDPQRLIVVLNRAVVIALVRIG